MVDMTTCGTTRVSVPLLASLALFGSVAGAQAQAIGPDFADMVEQVLPAVVHVAVESRQTGVWNPGGGMPGQPGPFRFGPFDRFDAPDGPEFDDRGGPRAVMAPAPASSSTPKATSSPTTTWSTEPISSP
ncbi:MAG: hypothetical protein R3F55_17285 [Alphaproteobacteria bacterium]